MLELVDSNPFLFLRYNRKASTPFSSFSLRCIPKPTSHALFSIWIEKGWIRPPAGLERVIRGSNESSKWIHKRFRSSPHPVDRTQTTSEFTPLIESRLPTGTAADLYGSIGPSPSSPYWITFSIDCRGRDLFVHHSGLGGHGSVVRCGLPNRSGSSRKIYSQIQSFWQARVRLCSQKWWGNRSFVIESSSWVYRGGIHSWMGGRTNKRLWKQIRFLFL